MVVLHALSTAREISTPHRTSSRYIPQDMAMTLSYDGHVMLCIISGIRVAVVPTSTATAFHVLKSLVYAVARVEFKQQWTGGELA